MGLEGEDVKARKQDRISDVRRRKEKQGIGPFDSEVDDGGADGHESKENVFLWERELEIEDHSRAHGQDKGHEILRIDEPLNHAFFTSVFWAGWEAFRCFFCRL